MTDGAPLPLVGPGPVLRALAARAEELRRDVTGPVLVIGARGLGKRHLARRIHAGSSLADVPVHLVDARHREHAASLDALRRGPAAVVLVRHIEQLAPAAQHLLDALRAEGHVARLLATAAVELLPLVQTGAFAERLGYALQGAPLVVPAIAERSRADRLALATAMLTQTADDDASLPTSVDASAALLLDAWPWHDNLREFEATLALAQLRARGAPAVSGAHLALPGGASHVPSASAALADVERWHLLRALAEYEGNRTRTARALGISRMTLLARLRDIDEAREP